MSSLATTDNGVGSAVDLTKEPPATIRMTVVQDDNGECKVIEHNLLTGFHRVAGRFPADQRKVLNAEGKDAIMDVAQVRAIVFAQMFEELVNSGKVMIG